MPRPRVLIIDDDRDVAQVLQVQLQAEGLRVSVTHHAEEGFNSAIQDPPQLVLLDVNLPGATGFQICDRLRKNASTSRVPIIMMSGAAKWSNQQQIGKNLGANDYVVKPFNIEDLSAKIHALLGTKPQEPEPEAPPEPVAAPEAQAPPAAIEPSSPEPLSADTASPEAPIAAPAEAPAAEMPVQHPAEPAQVLPEPEVRSEARDTAPAVDEQASPTFILPPASLALRAERPGVRWILAGVLMGLHAALAVASLFSGGTPAHMEMAQAALQVAGGWGLLLGLLVAVSALLGIEVSPRSALSMLSLAGIPIVLRVILQVCVLRFGNLVPIGAAINVTRLDMPLVLMRPLDLFEMTAAVILGLSLRRPPGGSAAKAVLAIILIAAAWLLAAHGYFQPL